MFVGAKRAFAEPQQFRRLNSEDLASQSVQGLAGELEGFRESCSEDSLLTIAGSRMGCVHSGPDCRP